ncbi:MAG TPA: hypothetical protein VNN18_05460 [Candidatus Xenobia bacterium]|nr:hypothetical protein [Candidatus Xenobia bacterium]
MTSPQRTPSEDEGFRTYPVSLHIERTGPPRKIRSLTDGGAVYQVALSAQPGRLWRSLFLEQDEYEPDFVPSLVRFTYHPPGANFAAEEWQLQARLKLLDLWIDATNRRCAGPARAERKMGPADRRKSQ